MERDRIEKCRRFQLTGVDVVLDNVSREDEMSDCPRITDRADALALGIFGASII